MEVLINNVFIVQDMADIALKCIITVNISFMLHCMPYKFIRNDYGRLGNNAVYFDGHLPTFRSNLLYRG
jgi:hypothetical protein